MVKSKECHPLSLGPPRKTAVEQATVNRLAGDLNLRPGEPSHHSRVKRVAPRHSLHPSRMGISLIPDK